MQRLAASALAWGCAALLGLSSVPARAQDPSPASSPGSSQRAIAFGTTLDPQAQMLASRELARTLANPNSPQWRAKGDQRRTYRFQEAGADIPFRVCVPNAWDGRSRLPLVMFLHGAGNTESSYLDQNGKQMVRLADERGFLLVSPLGHNGAYGTFLRLPAVFGQPQEAEKLLSQRTAETERTNALSEKDVLNVLEMVLGEYPVDSAAMFLTGHSMGSGGTWYIGGKYPGYWRALAPMSGPFVQEEGYPWDAVRRMPIFVTEGTGATPSLAGSRLLRDWMAREAFRVKYKEVNADHAGMVPLVLPDVFAFFDSVRTAGPVGLAGGARKRPARLDPNGPGTVRITVTDLAGRFRYAGSAVAQAGSLRIPGASLSPGLYGVRAVGPGRAEIGAAEAPPSD